MQELMIVIYIAALVFYILTWFVKRQEANWMGFFMSLMAIAAIIMDKTLSEDEVTILILPMFYVMIMTGLGAWGWKVRQ